MGTMANGRLENIKSSEDVKKIEKWLKDDIGLQDINGSLLLSASFVRMAYKVVFDFVKELAERVIAEYPEPVTGNALKPEDADSITPD